MGKTKSHTATKSDKRTAKKTSEGHQMSENRPAEIDHIDLKHVLVSAMNSHG